MSETVTANVQRLRIFVAVVDNLGFSRAAKSLSLSQPTVSGHIKELERILGVELFHHRKSRLALTEEGLELYKQAQKMIFTAEEIESELTGFKGQFVGRVTLACPESW